MGKSRHLDYDALRAAAQGAEAQTLERRLLTDRSERVRRKPQDPEKAALLVERTIAKCKKYQPYFASGGRRP